MDAETEFVLDLCARHRGLSTRGYSGRPFDLKRVIATATNHKVLPLLYAAWRVSAPPLSTQGWAALKQATATRTLVQTLLLGEWACLEPRLREAGVRCLVMKGPAWALQVYGDPRSRDYRDIDLLVEAGAMERAVTVFLAAGYVIDTAGTPPEGPQRAHFFRVIQHLVMVKPGRPLHFELHAAGNRVQGLNPADLRGLFRRSEVLEFEGTRFPTFGRSDHAVMVLLHGARHGWATLQWVLDGMAALGEIDLARVNALRWDYLSLPRVLDLFGLWASEYLLSPSLDQIRPPLGSRTSRALRLARLVHLSLATGGQSFVGRSRLFRLRLSYLGRLQAGWVSRGKSFASLLSANHRDLGLFLGWPFPFLVVVLARPFLIARRWVSAS